MVAVYYSVQFGISLVGIPPLLETAKWPETGLQFRMDYICNRFSFIGWMGDAAEIFKADDTGVAEH